jgi:hypothetical protein
MGKREGKITEGVEGGSKWILRTLAGGCTMEPVGSEEGPVAGSCEYGNECEGSGATDLVS